MDKFISTTLGLAKNIFVKPFEISAENDRRRSQRDSHIQSVRNSAESIPLSLIEEDLQKQYNHTGKQNFFRMYVQRTSGLKEGVTNSYIRKNIEAMIEKKADIEYWRLRFKDKDTYSYTQYIQSEDKSTTSSAA